MMGRIMRKRSLSVVVLCVLVAFSSMTLTGCSTDSSTGANVGKGAAGGAVLGAITGALLNPGNPWKGAAIGAAAGALVGAIAGFVWDYTSKQSKDYAQTQQDVQYSPNQGDQVTVTKYSLDPGQAQPGQPININTTYYVMTPAADSELNVKEVRYVKKYNPQTKAYEELGRENTSVTMKPGTRDGSGKITLPKDAEPGNYALGFGVAYKDKKDEKEVPVTITKAMGKLEVHVASATSVK